MLLYACCVLSVLCVQVHVHACVCHACCVSVYVCCAVWCAVRVLCVSVVRVVLCVLYILCVCRVLCYVVLCVLCVLNTFPNVVMICASITACKGTGKHAMLADLHVQTAKAHVHQ